MTEAKGGFTIIDLAHMLTNNTIGVTGKPPHHPYDRPRLYNQRYLLDIITRVKKDTAIRLHPVWKEPEPSGPTKRIYSPNQVLVLVDEIEWSSEEPTVTGRNLRRFFGKPAEVFNATRHQIEHPQP